jgi:hypothetical protein
MYKTRWNVKKIAQGMLCVSTRIASHPPILSCFFDLDFDTQGYGSSSTLLQNFQLSAGASNVLFGDRRSAEVTVGVMSAVQT